MQAGVICWRNGESGPEVLLVKTSDGKRWIFPKGTVENQETAPQAALRELAEEAGMVATLAPCFQAIKWKLETLVLFRAAQPQPLATACEPGRDPQWVPAAHARLLLAEGRTASEAQRLLAALSATETPDRDENSAPYEGRWCPDPACRGLLSYRRTHRGDALQSWIWCWNCGWKREIHSEPDYPAGTLVSSSGDGSHS